jgi:hypothetical protein
MPKKHIQNYCNKYPVESRIIIDMMETDQNFEKILEDEYQIKNQKLHQQYLK